MIESFRLGPRFGSPRYQRETDHALIPFLRVNRMINPIAMKVHPQVNGRMYLARGDVRK